MQGNELIEQSQKLIDRLEMSCSNYKKLTSSASAHKNCSDERPKRTKNKNSSVPFQNSLLATVLFNKQNETPNLEHYQHSQRDISQAQSYQIKTGQSLELSKTTVIHPIQLQLNSQDYETIVLPVPQTPTLLTTPIDHISAQTVQQEQQEWIQKEAEYLRIIAEKTEHEQTMRRQLMQSQEQCRLMKQQLHLLQSTLRKLMQADLRKKNDLQKTPHAQIE